MWNNFLGTLNQWFKVEKTERPWVISFFGSIFFISAANTLSWNLLQTLVIKRMDVEWLPVFFIASSFAFSLGGWYAITVLKKFRGLAQGIRMSLLAMPLGLVFAFTQQFFAKESSLLAIVLFVALGLVITTSLLYIGLHKMLSAPADVFNVEQVQRFESTFTSAMQLGMLLAGFLAAALSTRLSPTAMFTLTPILLFFAAPFCLKLHYLTKHGSQNIMIIDSATAPSRTIGTGWGLGRVFKDPTLRKFVYLLGAVMAMYMVFTRVFSYEFALAANSRFPSEREFNAFVGIYTAILSATTFVFVNTVQRWLFKRFGVIQNMFIPVVIIMVGVAGMFFWPVFPMVIAAVFSREVVLYLQKSSLHFLTTSLSDYQRAQTWSWLNGLPLTAGTLLGSGFLTAVAFLLPDVQTELAIRIVAIFAFEFLLLRLLVTWHVKRTYPQVLVHGLKEGDFKTRIRTMEALAEAKHLPDRHLDEILDIIRNPQEPPMLRIAGLKTISVIGDPSVLRVVGKLFRSDRPELRREAYRTIAAFRYTPEQLFEFGFSRQSLLRDLRQAYALETPSESIEDIFKAMIALRDPDTVPFLIKLLDTSEDEVRIKCLHSLRSFRDPGIIDVVRPLMDSANPTLKAMAIKVLWQFSWERHQIWPYVEELLRAPPDSEPELFGMYLIGALKLKSKKNRLIQAVGRPNPKTRLTAAIALFKLGEESGIPILEETLRKGLDAEANEVARLAEHPDVPESGRQRILSLIHQHHLHYPESLPVTEPLRIRLCNIPKDCLKDIRAYYAAPEDAWDLAKVDNALRSIPAFPAVKGRIALLGLDPIWQAMAGVTFLAHGYKARNIRTLSGKRGDEILVCSAEAGAGAPEAIILTDDPKLADERHLARKHYTPSKLIAMAEKIRPTAAGAQNPF